VKKGIGDLYTCESNRNVKRVFTINTVVAHDGSPVAAALATARGALSECRPVANDVLNLSALTGARSGTAGDALTMKGRERMSGCVSKTRACMKKYYLPQAGEAPFPFPRRLGGASTAPTGASAVPAGTSTDDPVTGGSMPASRVDSTASPLGSWGWGCGFPPIRGGPLPVALLLIRG
jgi:hypothetical protein